MRHLPGPDFAVFFRIAHLTRFIHCPGSLLNHEIRESEAFSDAGPNRSYLNAKGSDCVCAHAVMPYPYKMKLFTVS